MNRFSSTDLATLRHDLLARGQTLASLLADVLAGKSPTIPVLVEYPGMRPEEALRLALRQIEDRRTLLDHDDDRFGRCDRCGVDLGIARLHEMPWADRCANHRVD